MRNYNSSPSKWNAIDNIHSRMIGVSKSYLFERYANGAQALVERLSLTDKLSFHDGCVNAVNFSPCGELIVSGSDDLQVAIWDWSKDTKEPVLTYDSGHSSNVFQTKFMPHTNNSTVVTCARDGQVRVGFLKRYAKEQETKRIAQHKSSAHKLSIEHGSPNILKTAGEDATVFNIDLREPKAKKLLTIHNESLRKVALYSIDINPSNPVEFAVGGRDVWSRIYDARKITQEKGNGALKCFCPDHLKETEKFAPNITCLMYNYNGTELLCSYNDEDIYLFDTSFSSESNFVHSYKGHRNSDTVKGVNFFGPYSNYILSGSDCGHLFIWDKKKENIVTFLEGDNIGVVNVLEPHPTSCILATAGLDHDIKLWQPLGIPFIGHEKMEKQIKLNGDKRQEEQLRGGNDPFGDHLLLLMMRHLQRQRRRIARREEYVRNQNPDDPDREEELSEDSDSSLESDPSEDSSGENEDENSTTAKCVQS